MARLRGEAAVRTERVAIHRTVLRLSLGCSIGDVTAVLVPRREAETLTFPTFTCRLQVEPNRSILRSELGSR
jgi:hypothetical protein